MAQALHQSNNGHGPGSRPVNPSNANSRPESFHEIIDSGTFSDTVSFMPQDTDSDNELRRGSEHKVDNSRLNYVDVPLRCGCIAMCRTNVLTTCPSVLQDLNRDLTQCLEMTPRSVHNFIKRTKIWVNLTYSYGPQDNPRFLSHTTAHHGKEWLLWARDRPDKVRGIEIYDAKVYQRLRLHWNGGGLILHELCHLIHQHALEDGLFNQTVKKAFNTAKTSGRYDNVLRRDWAGMDEDYDIAYATVDHKEFFAEISVCFLCDTYHHLDKQDHTSMYHCSPPVLEPSVVERVRQKRLEMTFGDIKKERSNGSPKPKLPPTLLLPTKHVSVHRNGTWTLLFRFCKPKAGLTKQNHPPCNKFYPFTRGQLREYDSELYRVMVDLWKEIERWEDPDDYYSCGKGPGAWFPFLRADHDKKGHFRVC